MILLAYVIPLSDDIIQRNKHSQRTLQLQVLCSGGYSGLQVTQFIKAVITVRVVRSRVRVMLSNFARTCLHNIM